MQVSEVDALYQLGLALLFAGVFVLIVAIAIVMVRHAKKSRLKAAGVVVVGPVPIVVGTDTKSVRTVLLLSIVLTALVITGMVLYYLLFR
ncbi:MAG: DUF131 domain-containing protein [Candidatus Bathyarchaeia archaeon]